MAISAARLGSAPLLIDWSGLNGSAPVKPDTETTYRNAWSVLSQRFESGEVGFFNAVSDPRLHGLPESRALADKIKASGMYTDVLCLGIGGSSLGPISLLSSLRSKRASSLALHFLENPDPIEWKQTLSGLHPDRTLVVAITKSGTTFETMAQLMLSLEWLGKSRWSSHVVAITDPRKGDLKQFATEFKIPTLDIAPSLGGRFSVFSPVGLFITELAGLKSEEFLQGATQVRDYHLKAHPEKNPLYLVGSECIRQARARPIHVCMPYATPLREFGDWFAQLWAESLGKDLKGFTPLPALGATDQHSILQLLRDGPDDKITWFVTVDQVEDSVKIPNLFEFSKYPAFRILEGHSLKGLLDIEYRAISLEMNKRSRPQLGLQVDRLD
jgi:glucose-6-phosphate isomerase